MLSLVLIITSQAKAQEKSRNQLPKKQHRTSDAPFLKPDEAVAKMAIPKGFEVSVFAAEPDIAEPIAFCFDDKGRIWVAENFNYQTRGKHKQGEPVSRIQILEDTNGDGVFDNKKTFSDKLTFISGLACGFGGVYVGCPPNMSFIPDADGDDVPDGPPEVLLDGWGFHDRHETLNSFIWGPDGWLYGCHGVFTRSWVGKPGDAKEERQFIDGGIWRFHPTRKTFEVHARGLSNPWGFDFDDHGQGFATCCVIPHLFHVFQGGVYHKQSLPHVNPHIYDDIKTIRDHTHLSAHGGARFYLADAFPEPYNKRNYLFMCNIHEHAVLTDYMVPKGSSFIGKHGDDFMPVNDLAWVGFSIEIGPEGGVYVLDWHDTDICGNAINFPNSGRIYRITADSATPLTPPNLRDMSTLELAKLQTHDNDWYVRQARVLLHSRAEAGQDVADAQELLAETFNGATEVRKKLRAMWALYVTGALDEEGLTTLLDHPDGNLRGWAVRLLADGSPVNAFQDASQLEESMVSKSVLEKFAAMANADPSPTVRRFLSSAVQRMPFADRWSILKGLASHSDDVDDPNLPRMIWFGLEPMVPHHPEKALNLAVNGEMPKLAEFVARRLATGDVAENYEPPPWQKKKANVKQWQQIIQKAAPGFKVGNVGEGGVVFHDVFRNATAVQTHPLDKETPSALTRQLKIPADMQTRLNMRVSHHPHGDWQLQVFANKELLADQRVSSKTVGKDEWLDVSVDLSKFAGKTIKLSIENKANDWMNEWAYWNRVSIDSEPEAAVSGIEKEAKIVFISGSPSHGPMKHEHRAGNMILAKALNESGLNVNAKLVPHYGYPEDESILEDADTIVIFSTGYKWHVVKPNLEKFDALMKKGVGVVMIHWATEAEKGAMGDKFLQWMGGFCDLNWSVNPHWKPSFKDFPNHPICNGVEPFSIDDEWYYHMRFVDELKGVTPILTDVPPVHTLRRPDGERSGNPTVRKAVANGETQHVAWAYDRPDGGRGFGFTGAHNHESWQDENFRKVVLNAILWTAKVEVPQGGCPSKSVGDDEIKQNIDQNRKH
jgi:putative membrane-bound dehydrogenase-like protein